MKTIALDADGVLLDYNTAYAHAWQRAFGEFPALKNPNGYGPMDRWSILKLTGEPLDRLRAAFDEHFWSTIPAIPSALQACELLTGAGYELICVTALDERFAQARTRNLQSLGFPIARVMATGNTVSSRSPKADALDSIKPVAFVDDYAPYLAGVDRGIHLALIMRDPDGSPNAGELVQRPDSQHTDLLDFASWWCGSSE